MADNKQTQSSRRDFMKKSMLASVGVAGVLGNLGGIASGAFADGDDTIKIGLVGCGGRGSGAAAQALSTNENVKLVAMADAFEDNLEDSLYRIEKNVQKPERVDVDADHKFVGFDGYEKLINSGVDVVILATPPGFRSIHFEAAIKAGKHVFAEKPVATDPPGVRRFLAAVKEAKKKNLKVGIGLQRHHQNPYLETMKRIKDGAIGDVVTMRCYWNGGGVWVRPRKHHQNEMEYQMRNWYYFNWLCGDHIVEQHIHNLDVCNWLKGEHPVAAYGMGGREVRDGREYGEIFDHHAVEYEYADGTRMFSQCRHIRNCWNSVTEHAHGSKGYANISGSSIETNDGEKWRYRGKKNNPYQTEHDDLFAAIRTDTPYNEGEYGAHSTMTSILGRLATYSGKKVEWDKAINSEISLMPEVFDYEAQPPVVPDPITGLYPVAVPGVTKVV